MSHRVSKQWKRKKAGDNHTTQNRDHRANHHQRRTQQHSNYHDYNKNNQSYDSYHTTETHNRSYSRRYDGMNSHNYDQYHYSNRSYQHHNTAHHPRHTDHSRHSYTTNNASKPYNHKKRPNIGPQPHGFKKKRLPHLSKYQYWVTEKSDGIRLIAYISTTHIYFIDRKHDIHRVTDPHYSGSHGLPPNTVLDGELINTEIDNAIRDPWIVRGFNTNIQKQFPSTEYYDVLSICNHIIFEYYHYPQRYNTFELTYNIFDCILFNGTRVTDQNTSARLKNIDQFMHIYNKQFPRVAAHPERNVAGHLSDIAHKEDNNDRHVDALKDYLWNLVQGEHTNRTYQYSSECDHVEAKLSPYAFIFAKKTFFKSIQSDMKRLFSRITTKNDADGHYYYTDWRRGGRNRNDGVVFTPENNGYFMNRKGTNVDHIRKWKPLELNTIDVKVKIYNASTADIIDKFMDYDGFVALYVMDWDQQQEVVFDAINIGYNRLSAFQKQQQNVLRDIYRESNAALHRFRFLIVECCYDCSVQSWKILKWRSDKTRTNALSVCEDVRTMIAEGGVQPNDLIQACPVSYTQLQIVSNYNDKAIHASMEERTNSRTKHIRDMNNWCKYVLIMHGIRDSYSTNGNRKIHVLDLGCGKGGDLFKYCGNKKYVSQYLGMDIASECIEKAKCRYQEMRAATAQRRYDSNTQRRRFGVNNAYGQSAYEFYNEPLFDAEFVCHDMNAPNVDSHVSIQNKRPFDLISIQFALHYAFQSQSSLNALLKTIEASTKTGSYLVCSFVNDAMIIERLKEYDLGEETVSFRNEFQSITMKQSHFQRIKKIYDQYRLYPSSETAKDMNEDDICSALIGIPYTYYQMDSVDYVEEYLVSFWCLCDLLKKRCNMNLVYSKTWQQLKTEWSGKAPFKYGYLKRQLPRVWAKDEQQVLDTYVYVMFKCG